jgi:hypothetical protein
VSCASSKLDNFSEKSEKVSVSESKFDRIAGQDLPIESGYSFAIGYGSSKDYNLSLLRSKAIHDAKSQIISEASATVETYSKNSILQKNGKVKELYEEVTRNISKGKVEGLQIEEFAITKKDGKYQSVVLIKCDDFFTDLEAEFKDELQNSLVRSK